MRTRSMVVVALPALLALALLQPRPVPAAAPAPEPSADQIDAAVRYAQADAGLGSPAVPHRR